MGPGLASEKPKPASERPGLASERPGLEAGLAFKGPGPLRGPDWSLRAWASFQGASWWDRQLDIPTDRWMDVQIPPVFYYLVKKIACPCVVM